MKTIKNKQGISLIVLVITIIIMIILAAAIIITLSSTGIINQAEKGTNAYSENDLKHKVSLILGDAVVEKVNTRKDIVTYVAEHEEVDELVDDNEETFTIAMDGYIITINKQTLEIEDMAKDTAFRKETSGKARFVLDPATGYSKTVKVSIEVDADLPAGLEVQYNLVESSKDSTNWTTYTSGQIAELTKNQTVYGRIINSTTKEIGYSFRKEITAIETEAPKANISLDKTSVATSETVTATVTQSDEKSGIDITKCKYIVNTSSELLGTDNTSWSSATAFTTTPQNISITKTAAGTYYLHVLSVDKCGNMIETVSNAIKFKGTVTYLSRTYLQQSGLNEIGWKYNNWKETTSMSTGDYEPKYFVSGQKYDISDISKIDMIGFLYYANHYSYNTVVTFGLVETQDSTEFIVKDEFSFGKNVYGDLNLQIDTSNITGEYYIKCQVQIVEGDVEQDFAYSRVDGTSPCKIVGTP